MTLPFNPLRPRLLSLLTSIASLTLFPLMSQSEGIVPSTHHAEPSLHLEAQQLTRTPEEVKAEGDVHLEYKEWIADSASLMYNFTSTRLHAPDPISLSTTGIRVEGRCADITLNTHTGTVEKPSLTVESNDSPPSFRYLKADQLTFVTPQETILDHVRYSGCPGETPDWWLQSRQIAIHQDTGVGEAKDSTLYFKGVPLFYTPWMNFPIKGQRKTGLLPPILGTSGERGLEFQLPLYLNLADNYDATLTPRSMSKRGLQLSSQFRYLTPQSSGDLNGEWLSSDQQTHADRYFASIKHESHFENDAHLRLNLNQVSDSRYFTDLSDRISSTSQGALPRELDTTYPFKLGEGGSHETQGVAQLRVQRFQALQTLPSDLPFERVPQFTLNTSTSIYQQTSATHSPFLQGNLSLNTYTDIAKFRQATKDDVDRAIVYPQLDYTHRTASSLIQGHLGLNGRIYRYTDPIAGNTHTQIWTPITRIDAKTFLDPDTPSAYRPTLETRAYYVYIPYRAQSDTLPIIDSAAYSSEELGLFNENDFTGFDRINDANRLTLAVNAHWKHPTRDTERLTLGIAQRHAFQAPRVSPGDLKLRSPLFVYGQGEMGKGFHWSVSTSYDLDKKQAQQSQASIQYRPTDESLIHAAYRYQRNTTLAALPEETWRQIDISGQWTFSPKWKGLWRWNYDMTQRKLIEALGGLEYTQGCWGMRAVGQHLVTSQTSSTHAFFLQLELDGLGQLGSNPMDVLRRSIPGYIEPRPSSIKLAVPTSPK